MATAPPRLGEVGALPPGQFSPWWPLFAFALVAVAAGIAGLPAPAAAALLLGLFGVAVAWHPANGLSALVLASPFFLGEPKTPYFLLAPLAAGLVLLSFVAHRLRGRLDFTPVYGGRALLFLGAAVVALPLNLRDLLEDLWLVGSLDWAAIWQQGVPDISHLKYLDRLLGLGLGVGLFAVASQRGMLPAVLGAARPLGVLVAILSGFGLLRFFGLLHTSGQYLTLSFWTWQHPDLRLTGVAWNPDYLAQWLSLVLPLLVVLAVVEGSRRWRVMAAVAAVLGGLAVLFTFQRAAYLAGLVALGILALLGGHVRPGRSLVWRGLVVAGVLALVVGVGLDVLVLHGRVAERLARFGDDPNRLRLWGAALQMARDHPFLGVGTGRYPFFFQEYVGPELARGFPFWGTAHSLYLHLLAEQGLLGLATFLLFFGGVWAGALRRLGRLDGLPAALLSGILAALAGWFAYGLVQFTFRVDALLYLVCILTGAAAALAPPERRRVGFRRWAPILALGLVVLVVRAETALQRPVSAGYEAGFYRWERQPDGRPARWTRRRAAMAVPVGGHILALPMQAPIPGVEARPHVVRVRVDRRPWVEVRLLTPGWRIVEVPVETPPGGRALVELEVASPFVPSARGASRDERVLGVMVGEVTWRDG